MGTKNKAVMTEHSSDAPTFIAANTAYAAFAVTWAADRSIEIA